MASQLSIPAFPGSRFLKPLAGLLPGVLACWFACAPPPPPAAPLLDEPTLLDESQYRTAQLNARAQLAQAYGQALRLRTDARSGTVAFMRTPPIALADASSYAAAFTQFVLSYRSLFGVLDEDDLKHVDSEGDVTGMWHEYFVQAADGLPIWGSELVGHFDPEGRLVHIHGRLFSLHLQPSAPSDPTLQIEQVRQQALAKLRSELPLLSATAGAPSLYYLAGDHGLDLVYRLEVAGQAGDEPVRLALFIDAHTGELLRREDLVARVDVTVPASGQGKGVLGDSYDLAISRRGTTYSLEDPTRGKQRTTAVHSGEKLPGKTVTSKAADAWDASGQAVDVHAHLQTLWDYFATRHQHFGWDGDGSGIVAVTHLGMQAPLALFDGERLLFGDGDGKVLLPSGVALDLVAHEYAHAISRSSAELAGEGESGAVDEGLADLWGCLIEQAVEPTGGDWNLGERVLMANQPPHGGTGKPAALRDLADPARTGQASSLTSYEKVPDSLLALPAARSLLVRDAQHKNAGITGHAGYLLAQRIGTAATAAIVYRALTLYLHRYSGFADAADAMAAAAHDLYGDGAQQAAVIASWADVEVHGLGL